MVAWKLFNSIHSQGSFTSRSTGPELWLQIRVLRDQVGEHFVNFFTNILCHWIRKILNSWIKWLTFSLHSCAGESERAWLRTKWSGKEWLEELVLRRWQWSLLTLYLCREKWQTRNFLCIIIISKVLHDSSHLSLWPTKVLEEFLNPRTGFPTESSQFPPSLLHVWIFFRKVLEEFFKAENEFPASSSPPMGLSSPPLGLASPPMGLQPNPPTQPYTQQSIHTGESGYSPWTHFTRFLPKQPP